MAEANIPTILLTDDEKSIRKALGEILELEGYKVLESDNGVAALDIAAKQKIDLMFLDIKMKGMDGMEVLEKLSENGPDFPVIMLSGHGSVETAVQATKLGAYDFLEKPPDLNRLLITVRNALDKTRLVKQNRTMRRKITNVTELIGESKVMQDIKETLQRVAPTDARVLITGDNGTGKELVARWLHEYSNRNDGTFVDVNCAAIPSELMESELFGHEKGSFTGATQQRIGKFEQAHEGTLFLDEIGDMSPSAQAKVLRALQESVITRVGGNESITVNVRVVAATNKDLQEEISEGRFREDLFHRLNVIPVHVPPLKERRSDIPLLAQKFLDDLAAKEIHFAGKKFTDAAMEKLTTMNWPGNVRELHNVVERLAILSNDPEINVDLVCRLTSDNSKSSDMGDVMENVTDFQLYKEETEKRFLIYHLNRNDWNISQTADEIGIQRSHLYNKLNKYGIER